jgi:hypothetical protein
MCKYCDSINDSRFQTFHELYKNIGTDTNALYIVASLQTGGISGANIRIESASENKVNRGTFSVNFCPMCGEKI